MSSYLKRYIAQYYIPNAGKYVPPDPCSGGDYYPHLYFTEIIPAYTLNEVKSIVKQMHEFKTIKFQKIKLVKEDDPKV